MKVKMLSSASFGDGNAIRMVFDRDELRFG